ncbi:MAG TPA: AMP-binding protein, partial [Solirubrobacteraceae bacterium]|nr:AMP-binding protein [Solirubrobacteraceae bacterium]
GDDKGRSIPEHLPHYRGIAGNLMSDQADGLEQLSDEARRAHRQELTPLSFLERSVQVYPGRVAVTHERRQYTYRELGDRVNRLASALVRAGLQKGDRVAYICPNIPALLEGHFAVPLAGGVLVALNYRLGASEIARILDHARARFLFVDHEFEHLAVHANAGISVIRVEDSGAPEDPYEAFLTTGSPQPLPITLADENEAISINYTSGTTGSPKGAVYHHRGAYLNALGEVIETRLTSASVCLWTLPMFHCNGWCFPWAVTAVGGRHVCLRKVDPARIWGLIEREAVTHYNAAPTVQTSLINNENAQPIGREITTCVSGSPPSRELFVGLRRLGITPIHVYGATELYGPYMICEPQPEWGQLPLDDQAALLSRQGVNYVVACPVRVVDDDGFDVPADGATLGEVLMRGNTVMTGYFRDPEQTELTLADGWYHSGDLAVRHQDGYVELRDRKKDIIISGGENISSIEVERAIRRHPAVLDVAVVSTPDEKWGERPKAFVEVVDGAEVSPADIIAFAEQHLPRYMRPDAVEFRKLTRTATGKTEKKPLRDKEWAGHDRRVG